MAHTRWGGMRVVDAHVHFFSHGFYSALARQKGAADAEALGPELGWEIPPADPVALAARWVQELDRHGVARACLIASVPGDEGSVSAAAERYPDRFFGYFLLDPLQPDAAARVERASHVHAVCLFPAMHRYSIADPRVEPVLAAAAERRLAVFVHCGALSVGVRDKLGLPSPFDMRYSNPLDLHAVALRHAGVRFVVPHFGAGLLREALLLADLCPNVSLDTSSSNRWMRYEGLDLRAVFSRAIETIGAERLLFGTDSSFFPRGWQQAVFEQQATALYELGASAADAQKIFAGNAERLLLHSA